MRANRGNVNRMSRDYTGKKYNNLMKWKKNSFTFFCSTAHNWYFKNNNLFIYLS
jgi:uncharacterized protein YneR